MTSHKERDDDYYRVITKINDCLRVIICCDGLQWILQKREGKRHGKPRWTGVSYCITRSALIRVTLGKCRNLKSGAMDCLNALPEKIEHLTDE